MRYDGFGIRRGVAALIICALVSAPIYAAEPQAPQPENGGVGWGDAGVGAATMLADVVYMPVKFIYASMGAIVGGFAFVFTGGNTQVSNTIWRSSLGGDYVLTPNMLRGKEPIHFSGPTQVPPPQSASSTGASGSSESTGASGSTDASTTAKPFDHGTGPLNQPHSQPTPDTSIQ
jgi:hypothetical protein